MYHKNWKTGVENINGHCFASNDGCGKLSGNKCQVFYPCWVLWSSDETITWGERLGRQFRSWHQTFFTEWRQACCSEAIIEAWKRSESWHSYVPTYIWHNQGDQICFWKNRPKCSPNSFLSLLTHQFDQSRPKNLGCICNLNWNLIGGSAQWSSLVPTDWKNVYSCSTKK
jgi:hypothetical protein